MIIVRELVGGLYFGEKGIREDGTWFDTCEYSRPEVERIARRGFEIAQARGGRLTSVDKVNVMHTSRLWRDVVTSMGASLYPTVELDHALVDSFAMTIVQAPETIDTVVTENTFGDILSDVAAAVTGGLGLAASASLADDGPGIFEPVHGSAPQLAGRGIANPAAMLRSVALLLTHALDRTDEASALERAIDAALTTTRLPTWAARARRARSARRYCGTWTRPVPCDDDVSRIRRFRLRDLRLRLYRASRRLRSPAPRRLAESRRTDFQRKATLTMASIELTVAYPGREGAHSAAACDRLFPAARLIALPTFSDVVDAVAAGTRALRRPADRELARRPCRRDARPPLRVAALDRGGSDHRREPLPRRPAAGRPRGRPRDPLAPCRARPVPQAARVAPERAMRWRRQRPATRPRSWPSSPTRRSSRSRATAPRGSTG